jgi:hypothetical protein
MTKSHYRSAAILVMDIFRSGAVEAIKTEIRDR